MNIVKASVITAVGCFGVAFTLIYGIQYIKGPPRDLWKCEDAIFYVRDTLKVQKLRPEIRIWYELTELGGWVRFESLGGESLGLLVLRPVGEGTEGALRSGEVGRKCLYTKGANDTYVLNMTSR